MSHPKPVQIPWSRRALWALEESADYLARFLPAAAFAAIVYVFGYAAGNSSAITHAERSVDRCGAVHCPLQPLELSP